MTQKEFLQECRRITKVWNKWRPVLGLSEWDVKLHFYKDVDEEDLDVEAWAHASWEYIRGDLHFIVPKTVTQTLDELEEIVVHEGSHIILKEMQSWATCDCDKFDMRHEERVCTMFSRALIRAQGTKK